MPRLGLWIAVAVAGVLVAVAITTAATRLTQPEVGLQAEPIDAGRRLAPTTPPAAAGTTAARTTRTDRTATGAGATRTTATPTPVTPTPALPSTGEDKGDDDGSGRGRGRNRGRGGDD